MATQSTQAARPRPAANPKLAIGDVIAGVRVLVVDDDPISRNVVKQYLTQAGALVETARDGKEALERLIVASPGSFDAVLMDIEMPVMDGLEAARRIRSEPRYAKLPIIALTAHAIVVECQHCLDAGMDDHIIKPASRAEIVLAVERNVKHRVLHRTPAPAVTPPEPSRRTLDTETAIAKMNGNRGFYEGLLRQFAARYGSLDMVGVLSKRGPRAAQLSAHMINGLAETIGAMGLQATANELEVAIAGGRPDVLALARAFNNELAEVVGGIHHFLEDAPAASAAAHDS